VYTLSALVVAGITLYTVACEPAISNYIYARDFMKSVADITQGQAVALGSAQLLVDVILGKLLCYTVQQTQASCSW
jgi:hypothetical protein